jgi:predicted dehydrogenase
LVQTVDGNFDFLAVKAKELVPHGFTYYCDLLNADIYDAISIAKPHQLHYLMVLDFISKGILNLMQIPSAMRLSEAVNMVRLADKYKILLIKFDDSIIDLAEILNDYH